MLLQQKAGGCIVDAICQVSTGDYPLISVSINKKSYTNELLHKNNKFAVSIIGKKTNKDIIEIYGFHSMRDYDKFKKSNTQIIDNLHIIPDSVAYLICEKVDIIENETHTLFIGRIVSGRKMNEDEEMTYSYYQKHKEDLIKVKTQRNKTAWVCLMCGYVYYGEELPEEFVCPQCGVGIEMFEKRN